MDIKKQIEEAVIINEKKEAEYGNSYMKVANMLEILYPNGISIDNFNDFLSISKILEKIARLSSDGNVNNLDIYRDVAGYALIGIMKDKVTAANIPSTTISIISNPAIATVYLSSKPEILNGWDDA